MNKKRYYTEYPVTAERDDDGYTRSGDIGYVNLPEDLKPEDLPDRLYIDGYEYKRV